MCRKIFASPLERHVHGIHPYDSLFLMNQLSQLEKRALRAVLYARLSTEKKPRQETITEEKMYFDICSVLQKYKLKVQSLTLLT